MLRHGDRRRRAARGHRRPCQAIILAQHRQIAGIAAANRPGLRGPGRGAEDHHRAAEEQRFGPSSEKLEREIEQLELALESLETARAAVDTAADPEADHEAVADAATPEERLPPRRRGAPRIADDAPRESIVLDPGERCPDCGGVARGWWARTSPRSSTSSPRS
jgi:transposase